VTIYYVNKSKAGATIFLPSVWKICPFVSIICILVTICAAGDRYLQDLNRDSKEEFCLLGALKTGLI
jgi:hypothetical protein